MNDNLKISAFLTNSEYLETTCKHLQFKSTRYLNIYGAAHLPRGPIRENVVNVQYIFYFIIQKILSKLKKMALNSNSV